MFNPEQPFVRGPLHLQDDRYNNIDLLVKSLWHLVVKSDRVEVRSGEDVLLKNDYEKIRKIAGHIYRFYQSIERRFYFTLSYVKGFGPDRPSVISIVQRLVTTVFDQDLSRATRRRAEYALILLEKADPHLATINHLIRVVKDKTALKEERREAFDLLKCYARNKRGALQVTLPIRPLGGVNARNAPLAISRLSKNSKVHDQFWKIRSLCVDKDQEIWTENLKDVGQQEGFAVSVVNFGHEVEWLRDPMLPLQDGTILLPARYCFIKNDKVSDLDAVRTLLGDSYAQVMGVVAQNGTTQKLLDRSFTTQREAPFYFEGGNLLYAMNKKDELFCLSGAQNLLFSLLNAAFTFYGREEALVKYMEGLSFSKESVAFVRERLCGGKVMPFEDEKTQVWLAKLAIAAIEYIKEMMEEVLGLPVLHIGDPFISQPAFHLDIFLLPAPNGKIFIQDHFFCMQLIERLIRTPKLPESHRLRLGEYHESARLKYQAQSGEFEVIFKFLTDRGFEMVRTPGLFFDRNFKMGVNFLNSVVGGAKKGTFCLTNGSSHPVDEILREYIVKFYRAHGIERVYFAGRATTGEITASGGLEYIYADQRLGLHGGVHCLTREINALFKSSTKVKTAAQPAPTPKESFTETLPFFFETMVKIGMRMKTPELPETPLFRVIDPPLESKVEFKESKRN
ncbi:MAG: hypothetical protein HYX48_02410 [Chlamydiales bacterium]|nr:hypothetical protein [Chlamydiales bacterium]